VVAVKQKENDEAIKTLQALEQAKPEPGLLDKGLRLLGQVYAAKSDYKNAAEIWKRILAGGKVEKEGELREQLAKALFANGDFAGSRAQFEAACPLLGGDAKLARDSRETWARALFNAGDFPGAAAKYGALHESFKSAPAYAYECAVSHERATNWVETVKWYAVADKERKALPEAYAAALDASLAKARLQAGSGDQGLSYWLSQLGTNAPGADFEAAAAVLARITAAAGSPDNVRARLEALLKDYAPTGPRYYTSGALLLQWLAANDKKTDLKQWADKLAADLGANEAALPPKTFGSTLALAMIHFFRGEADRLAGKFADALASYETVLAAYPYNEWPDAAGCRAAECYAGLGDKATALSKWNEVIKSAGTSPGSAKWRELAAQKVKTTQGE
jgi:tetratricopeptide (TPR) repeat protein